MAKPKIIFAGTPDFSVPCLQALLDHDFPVLAVYTQPDRPAGRGKKLQASPVKQLALQHDLRVEQPVDFKNESAVETLADLQADLMIVVAYGLILPKTVLNTPKLGCINVHASLLPRWRGAAPIQRAILAGDQTTGVTIMQMDIGLDTGDMLLKQDTNITETDTGSSLHDRLAELGASSLLEALNKVQSQSITAEPQDDSQATYAAKLSKAEAQINWSSSAVEIDRLIRAFNAWPVAFSQLNGQNIRIWQASPIKQNHQQTPGSIISADKTCIVVAAAEGMINITELQLPGAKRLTAQQVLNARQDWFTPGTQWC